MEEKFNWDLPADPDPSRRSIFIAQVVYLLTK